MNELNPFDLGWFVGILEGEGTFAIERKEQGKYKYPRVKVKMTDVDIIIRLHQVSGVGDIYGPYTDPKRPQDKQAFVWRTNRSTDAVAVLNLIYPYMGERRKQQIEEGLSFVPGRQPDE
jgi:hypothetical protein